jgi:hypothetical protein
MQTLRFEPSTRNHVAPDRFDDDCPGDPDETRAATPTELAMLALPCDDFLAACERNKLIAAAAFRSGVFEHATISTILCNAIDAAGFRACPHPDGSITVGFGTGFWVIELSDFPRRAHA